MNVQQLFYILGSLYMILGLVFLIGLLIAMLVAVNKIKTTKRRWEVEMKNRKVISSKTFKAVLPMVLSLGTTWGLNKLKKTLTNS